MATDFTSQITAWYQAVQFRNPPAADLATYNASLQANAANPAQGLTAAQVQSLIVNDPFTINTVNVVIREYQAAFGRVPDQAGLNFWVDTVAANPSMLATLNTTFANSDEFKARFGATADTTANPALVASIYQQVYNRPPDAAGLSYWSTGFPKDANGNPVAGAQPLTAAQLLKEFANASEFVGLTSAAVTAFENLELAGTPPTTGSLFSVAGGSLPGISQTFKAETDLLVGTSGNDTFTGDNSGANPFVSIADSADGKGGTDTFNEFIGANAFVLPQLTSVEIVNVIGGTAAQAVNVSTNKDITNLNIKDDTVGTHVITVGAGVTVGFDNVTAGIETVNFAATATSGALDFRNGSKVGAVTVAGAALTSLSANSTGSAANTVASITGPATITTLNVTGDQKLTVTGALDANVLTVNAGTDTGGVNLTLGAVAANKTVSVTTGTGADTISLVNVANAGDTLKVDLGAGKDTLKVGLNLNTFGTSSTLNGGDGVDVINIQDGADLTAATVKLISGFETLDVSGGTGTYDVTLGGFTKFQIDAAVSGALTGAVVLNNVPSTGFALDIMSAKATNFAVGNDVTFTLKDATGTADSVALNLTSVDGNNNNTAEGAITTGVIHLAGTETLTINANITTADTGVATTKYIETTTLEDLTGALKTLVITGNESVVVNGTAGGILGAVTLGAFTKVDASASTGNITIDYSNAPNAVTYLGSGGIDTIVTSNGGTVYGAGGNDVVTLAAGGTNADVLAYKAATDAVVKATGANIDATATFETVTNFLTTNSGDATHAHDTIDLSALGGFTGYARGAMTITNVNPVSGTFAASQTNFFNDGVGNRGVVLDVVGADTYVFVDANHDGNFTASADMIIKLAGVANATTTDFNFG